jgi:hypothetical protein
VAARSTAWICSRSVAGAAGLNPARGMNVCLLCFYVMLSCIGGGLCDGLITRPDESYRVFCMSSQKLRKGALCFKLGTEGK